MVKRVAATTVCILLFLLFVSAEGEKILSTYNPDYMNIMSIGAKPNDGEDDTEFFLMAMRAGKTIYVPAGVFIVTETIELQSLNLVGAGSDKSIIESSAGSSIKPIVQADRTVVIRDIGLRFREDLLTGQERMGERVGIRCGGLQWSLQRGTSFTNISISNVGTGIYTAALDENETNCAFSVTYESISVVDFTFRGIDFQSSRTGNIYRNIYVSSGKYTADSGFNMTKVESETDMNELTVAHSKLRMPVRFSEMQALAVTNLNIISTELTNDNTGFVYVDCSAGYIEGLNFINSVPDTAKKSYLRIGDNIYNTYRYGNLGYLRIGAMNIMNGESDIKMDPEGYFVSRKNAYMNEYTVEIEHYNYTTADDQKELYEAFRHNEKALTLIKPAKGGNAQ